MDPDVIHANQVPLDLWFTTRLDTRWNVKQIKHWLISKCLPGCHADPPSKRRSVSPITFAFPPEDSLPLGADDNYWDHIDDEESSLFGSKPSKSSTFGSPSSYSLDGALSDTSTTSDHPLHLQYTVLAFSTGQILEDQSPLQWYRLRPHELLEIHEAGAIVCLPRAHIDAYASPYIEVRVMNVQVHWSRPREEVKKAHQPTSRQDSLPKSKRQKSKSELQEKWVVIQKGQLILCRDRMVSDAVRRRNSADVSRRNSPGDITSLLTPYARCCHPKILLSSAPGLGLILGLLNRNRPFHLPQSPVRKLR
jgi:hypothetical protein